jgi:hypothetical protein
MVGQVTRVTFLVVAAVEQFFSSLPCARQVRGHPGFCIVGSRISWAFGKRRRRMKNKDWNKKLKKRNNNRKKKREGEEDFIQSSLA